MKYHLLILVTIGLFLSGCGTANVPTSYTDSTGATVQYSASDENILKTCSAIESNLPIIRSGAALSVGGVLQASIKQPSTLQNDGALCYQISSAVYSMTVAGQTTLPNGNQLKSIIGGFTSNATDATVVNDLGVITSALNSVYSSYYNQLTALGSQTTNSTVKATVIKTGIDVLNALAGGVMDGTKQYAPATPTTATAFFHGMWMIRWSDLHYV